MIVKIIAASEDSFSQIYRKDENEFIIGLDYGCKVLNDLNITIDLAIGDFDSYPVSKTVANIFYLYPLKKDYSDLELAILETLKFDFEKIEIYNASGRRIDHFIATLNIIKKYHQYNIILLDDINKVYVINGWHELNNGSYENVSFFAIEDETVISLKGFLYNLEDYHLKINDNLCLSNRVIENALVSTNKPILVILSK